MKFSTAAVIAFAAFVSATEAGPEAEQLPSCAAACMVTGAQNTGCQLSDLKCSCSNDKVRSQVTACVQQACPDAAAQIQVERFTIGKCASVGIKVEGIAAGEADMAPMPTRTDGAPAMPAMPAPPADAAAPPPAPPADAAAPPPADAAAAPPAPPAADAAPAPSRADADAGPSAAAGAMAPPTGMPAGLAGAMTPPPGTPPPPPAPESSPVASAAPPPPPVQTTSAGSMLSSSAAVVVSVFAAIGTLFIL